MKRWAMIGAVLAAAPAAAQGTDEAAIRAIEARQEAAWNAHDIAAYVQPLAPDAQFVTALGLWWKDRAETQRKMGYAFRTLFARSRLHIDDVAVASLSPDVAIAHLGWTMESALRPDGSDAGTLHGIQSQTLRRTGAGWQIASAQDTLVVSERSPVAEAAPAPAIAPPAKTKRCLLARSNGACLITKKSRQEAPPPPEPLRPPS